MPWQKTYYNELLEAGVEIYEYKPGFVHAKVFVSDDEKATVGTINLDYRSFYHHFDVRAFHVPEFSDTIYRKRFSGDPGEMYQDPGFRL